MANTMANALYLVLDENGIEIGSRRGYPLEIAIIKVAQNDRAAGIMNGDSFGIILRENLPV
jgi:hypothetical protein